MTPAQIHAGRQFVPAACDDLIKPWLSKMGAKNGEIRVRWLAPSRTQSYATQNYGILFVDPEQIVCMQLCDCLRSIERRFSSGLGWNLGRRPCKLKLPKLSRHV